MSRRDDGAVELLIKRQKYRPSRFQRYLEYTNATLGTNQFRADMFERLKKLPGEMSSAILGALAKACFPEALTFRSDTLGAMSRCLLSHLCTVTVIRVGGRLPDQLYGAQDWGRMRGLPLKTSAPIDYFRQQAREAIVENIGVLHVAEFSTSQDISRPLIPSCLTRHSQRVVRLHLHIRIPALPTGVGFYPLQLYLAEDALPRLQNSLPKLKKFKLDIVELPLTRYGELPPASPRGPYRARTFKISYTTMEAELENIIKALRGVKLDERAICFYNEVFWLNEEYRHETYVAEMSVSARRQEDHRKCEDAAEVAKEAASNPGVEFLV